MNCFLANGMRFVGVMDVQACGYILHPVDKAAGQCGRPLSGIRTYRSA